MSAFNDTAASKYLDLLGSIVIILDKDGYINLINKRGCELLGYKKEELLGKKWHENYVNKKDVKKVKNIIKEVFEGNINSHEYFECLVQTKIGERVIYWHNSLLKDKNGEIVALLCVGEDITTQKIREKKLKNSEKKFKKIAKEKGLLIDILTHELRNYLTASTGFLELVLEKSPSNIEHNQRVYVEKAKGGIAKALQLLNNLMVLLKQSIDAEIILKKVNLSEVIERAEIYIKDIYPNRKISFNMLNLSDKNVLADKLLEQVFLNIFANSVRYGRENVVITVKAEKTEGSKIKITVEDNGLGISEKKKKLLFKRFGKLAIESGGTGLGLFIVHSLITRYNGSVKISDRVEGDHTKGTKVEIELLEAV